MFTNFLFRLKKFYCWRVVVELLRHKPGVKFLAVADSRILLRFFKSWRPVLFVLLFFSGWETRLRFRFAILYFMTFLAPNKSFFLFSPHKTLLYLARIKLLTRPLQAFLLRSLCLNFVWKLLCFNVVVVLYNENKVHLIFFCATELLNTSFLAEFKYLNKKN